MPAPLVDASEGTAPEPRSHPLATVLVAVAVGIVFDRYRPLRLETWWAIAAVGVTVWVVILLRTCYKNLPSPIGKGAGNEGGSYSIENIRDPRSNSPHPNPLPKGEGTYFSNTPKGEGTFGKSPKDFFVAFASNLALLSAVAATAGAWHHCCWNLFADDDLGLFARRKAEPICVEAVAVERPRELPPSSGNSWGSRSGSRLLVELVALRDRAQWRPVSGRATLLVYGDAPQVEAGDRLRCFARPPFLQPRLVRPRCLAPLRWNPQQLAHKLTALRFRDRVGRMVEH